MAVSSRVRLAIAVAVAVVAQIFLLRIGAVESDEGLFAACAVRQIVEHAMPLASCVDTKPPGIFLLYEAAFRLFGNYSPLGLRLIWVICALGLAASVRAIRRGAAGDDAAALCLLLLTTSNYFLALKTELPAIALATAGIALAQRRSMPALLAAGALFGGATLFKQPAALFMAVGAIAARPSDWHDVCAWLKLCLCLAVGFTVPLMAVAASYWHAGQWPALIGQIWVRPSLYALHKSPGYSGITAAWDMARRLVPQLCAIALFAASAWQRQRRVAAGPDWLAWAYLGAALIFMSIGGHFFTSYAVVAIPAVALLLTPTPLPGALNEPGGKLAGGAFLVALVTTLVTISVLTNANKADVAVAREIDRAAAPGDRLYVWGYVPELYPAVGQLPASRFVASTVLFGYFHDSAARVSRDAGMRFVLPGDWDAFLADLERQPFVLVDTSIIRMGAPRNFAPEGFPRMRSWMQRHCTPQRSVGDFPMYRCTPPTR